MPQKSPTIRVRLASLTLTSTFAPVLGTNASDQADTTTGAVKLGAATSARAALTYTRDGASSSGLVKVRAMVSMDAPTTAPAAVANWTPAAMRADGASTAGVLSLVPEVHALGPSASGAAVVTTPVVDVSTAHWLRFELCDADATHPGAISAMSLVTVA